MRGRPGAEVDSLRQMHVLDPREFGNRTGVALADALRQNSSLHTFSVSGDLGDPPAFEPRPHFGAGLGFTTLVGLREVWLRMSPGQDW